MFALIPEKSGCFLLKHACLRFPPWIWFLWAAYRAASHVHRQSHVFSLATSTLGTASVPGHVIPALAFLRGHSEHTSTPRCRFTWSPTPLLSPDLRTWWSCDAGPWLQVRPVILTVWLEWGRTAAGRRSLGSDTQGLFLPLFHLENTTGHLPPSVKTNSGH